MPDPAPDRSGPVSPLPQQTALEKPAEPSEPTDTGKDTRDADRVRREQLVASLERLLSGSGASERVKSLFAEYKMAAASEPAPMAAPLFIEVKKASKSDFPLGRFVRALTDDVQEGRVTVPDECLSQILFTSEKKETMIAALKLAEASRGALPDGLTARVRTLFENDCDVLAAKGRARAAQLVNPTFESVKAGLPSEVDPFQMIPNTPRGTERQRELLVEQLTTARSLIAGGSDAIRTNDRVQALETLASHPEISIPGGMDNIIKRCAKEVFRESESPLLSLLTSWSQNSYPNYVCQFAFRMIEAGRVENPLELLQGMLEPGLAQNDRIVEFIERSPSLRDNYSIDQLIADRHRIGAAEYSPERRSSTVEARFARLFARHLDLPADRRAEIGVPMMNMLGYIHSNYPDALKALAGSNQLSTLTGRLSSIISDERQAVVDENRVIYGDGVRVTAFAHQQGSAVDPLFQAANARFKMENLGGVRGSDDPFETVEQKELFLERVGVIARDNKTPSTISVQAHGGPNHVYLSDGRFESAGSNDLSLPNAVSYSELARTMVTAQAANGTGQIDFSNVTIILDACIQHDFARKVRNEIEAVCTERDLTLKGLPLIMSASQGGQPGYGTPFWELGEEMVRQLPQDGSPFKFEHLLAADRALNARQQRLLDIRTTEERLLPVQDPAIFSPRVFDNSRIEEILRSLLPEDALRRSRNVNDLIRPLMSTPHFTPVRPPSWWNEISTLTLPERTRAA